jgi:hypothetical protein
MADKISSFPDLSSMDTDDTIPVVDDDIDATRVVNLTQLLTLWDPVYIDKINELAIEKDTNYSYSPNIISGLSALFFSVIGIDHLTSFDEFRLPDNTTQQLEVYNSSTLVFNYNVVDVRFLLLVHDKANTVNVNLLGTATFSDGSTTKPLTQYDILFLLVDRSNSIYYPVFYVYTP